ncbi:MAG: iron-containing alcohol dehydrogenase [Synergistaceae bacterium]|nr:iron-containing alcohol dehydrogenase [Synergistaceae bacterium]
MINFDFKNPTRVIFGKGTISQLGDTVKEFGGTKVLLHYGGGSIKSNGVYDVAKKSLDDAGLRVTELGGVRPNPRLTLIHEGIEICRSGGINFIIAVGGGSVIDSAKAIGVGVPYDGEVWDFYTGKALPAITLPVATVLTIPAAGSEVSFSSVVTNDDGAFKRPLDINVIYPVFSILDPETTYSLPPYQTACGISDMLTHVIERYFTRVSDVELTDRLCEATMKTIISNAPVVLADPKNYAARSEIMWSGSIAHNNILDTGRIGDWASHMIEHELSAINDVAHGAGLAIIVPAWMRYVYKHDVERFAQFAARVLNIEQNFHNPEITALRGIDALKAFFKSIGMPVSLSEIDIKEESFKSIAEKVRKIDEDKGIVGNFVQLTEADIVEILKLAR